MNALSRRRWLNLGLLGAVSGLATLTWLEPGWAPVVSPLLNLVPAQIERIRVERRGQDTLAFERRGDQWRMTAPSAGLANQVLINPILQLAEAHCPVQYPAGAIDLKMLRLDPPPLRLWLNDREIGFGGSARPMTGVICTLPTASISAPTICICC